MNRTLAGFALAALVFPAKAEGADDILAEVFNNVKLPCVEISRLGLGVEPLKDPEIVRLWNDTINGDTWATAIAAQAAKKNSAADRKFLYDQRLLDCILYVIRPDSDEFREAVEEVVMRLICPHCQEHGL